MQFLHRMFNASALLLDDALKPSAEGHPQTASCVPSSVWRCAVLLQVPGVALASCTDVR